MLREVLPAEHQQDNFSSPGFPSGSGSLKVSSSVFCGSGSAPLGSVGSVSGLGS